MIDYDPMDISCNISNGEMRSGIIDKKLAGQETGQSLFHIIHNDYGPKACLEVLYSIQQVTTNYLLLNGFTMGLKDLELSKDAITDVKRNIQGMLIKANNITEQLNKNSGQLTLATRSHTGRSLPVNHSHSSIVHVHEYV